MNMTEYEKQRVRLQIIHIIATLGVPFVVVALTEYFKVNYEHRRKNQPIIIKCISGQGTGGKLAK